MATDTDTRPTDLVGDRPRPRGGRVRRLFREIVSWPTVVTCALCVLLGIPAAVLLTPDQKVTVAGQQISVGARPPTLSFSGPAQLVQIGNTQLDIAPLQVFGPLRPRLTLGPVQRNPAAAAALDPATAGDVRQQATSAIVGAFLAWYAWAALILLAITLAITAVAGCVRMLVTLRRQSRIEHTQLTMEEVWHRTSGQIRGMAVATVAVTLLSWAGAGGLAYKGAVTGLQHVRSLSDLVGTYYLTPSPIGPAVSGFEGAVIGDSRASRAGGPALSQPTEDDTACGRTADSLANEVGALTSTRVANLACIGASVTNGLRGPQIRADRVLPPQVGLLKQLQDLKFVVVMIGPNDLSWIDQLTYCYAVSNCQDNLTAGEFAYRLGAFDRDYGNLLHDLNDLPGRPQVIVMTSYDLFQPDASCADAKGPAGAAGLNPDSIHLLRDRNDQLNDVLTSGAKKYNFAVASPAVAPLCRDSTDQLGPDIQGLGDSDPFHPTGIGMVRLASAVVRLLTTHE
jgi:lysophospholipase L1-like esterase